MLVPRCPLFRGFTIHACTHSIDSVHATYTTHTCIQERKKRTEEKKQRKLENQKKAELVQKVCAVVSGFLSLGQEGKGCGGSQVGVWQISRLPWRAREWMWETNIPPPI